MAPPRAAIVGAGLMGRWHARYAARVGTRVTAIVDRRVSAAEDLQRTFPRARTFAALEDCLAAGVADAVHVCTSAGTHVEMARAALMAGRHVLVEKPASATRADAQALADLARQRGLRLCPVHQFPFQRGMARAVAGLSRLGPLVRAEYVVRSAGGAGRTPADRRALVLEILPHPVSLFRAVLAPGGAAPSWDVVTAGDDEMELVGARAGVRLRIDVALHARPTRNELVLTGTEATARVDLFHGYAVFESGGTSRAAKASAPLRAGTRLLWASGSNLARRALEREPAFPGLRELIRRFYASIAGGSPPPVDPEEMVEAAALIEIASAAMPRA